MTPIWRIQNGQGPSWKYAQARIDSDTNYQVPSTCSVEFFVYYRIYLFYSRFYFFQIVFEGIWGNSRVSGYVAIDDITFFEGDCSSKFYILIHDIFFSLINILYLILYIYFSPIFLAVPEHAPLTKAECTFDRDSCAWRNTSTGDFQWRMAAVARRPANLLDKTYGAPVGYAYFDIFNTGSRLILTQFSGIQFFKFLFLVSKSQ